MATMYDFGMLRRDAEHYYSLSGQSLATYWVFKSLLNPSLRALMLIRYCSRATGVRYLVARSFLMSLHSCDVASGCILGERLFLPHPIGIVIGKGVVIGDDVVVFQNVTMGRDGKNRYPVIQDGAKLFAGCVVIGGVVIGPRTSVPALTVRQDSIGSDRQ